MPRGPTPHRWPLYSAIAACGTFAGLLVDFEGASTKLAQHVWPVVSALLPVLWLGGLVGSFAWLGGSIWHWYSPRRPSVRLKQRATHIRGLKEVLILGTTDRTTLAALHQLSVTLQKEFGIPCPDTRMAVSGASHEMEMWRWQRFLVKLDPLVELGDLKEARELSATVERAAKKMEQARDAHFRRQLGLEDWEGPET